MSADISESLDLFRLIANVCRRKSQYDLAYHYFQLAFDQMRPGIDETGILNSSPEELKRVKKIHYLSGLIIDKGDAYRQQFDVTKDPAALIKAIRIYKVADQFLNKIKMEQTDLQSKLFWRSDSRRFMKMLSKHAIYNTIWKMLFIFLKKAGRYCCRINLMNNGGQGENNILKQTQLEKQIVQVEKEMNADKSITIFRFTE